MTDWDYPPSRTVTLGSALDDVTDELAGLDDDAEERATLIRHQTGLEWAVSTFGEDATVTLQGYTTNTRSRTADAFNDATVNAGQAEFDDWLAAAGVVEAPWYDDTDITARAIAHGQLPPELADWLVDELADLNDLSAGN